MIASSAARSSFMAIDRTGLRRGGYEPKPAPNVPSEQERLVAMLATGALMFNR